MVSLEMSISQNSRLGSLVRIMFVVHSFAKVGLVREAMFVANSLAKTKLSREAIFVVITNKLKKHPRTGMIMITLSLFPTQ